MNTQVEFPKFALLHVGFAEHNADWNWKNVCSPFHRIHYIKSGEGFIKKDGKIIHLKPGYLYLTSAFESHSYVCDGRLELYYIHILEDPIYFFNRYDFPSEIKCKTWNESLIHRLIQLHPQAQLKAFDPSTYDIPIELLKNSKTQFSLSVQMESSGIIEVLLAQFLKEATLKVKQYDWRIEKALSFIHENLDKNSSLDLLSSICSLSKDHFIRIFKKEMGQTPIQYILSKKIEKAQWEMVKNTQTIKEIAYELGFENEAYFNRIFKKFTGETPGAYRLKIKKRD